MKVFIGYDPRQPVAFQVCAQSVWEHASTPVEIVRLELSKLAPFTRRGLTEFTFSRFLVPYLSGFEGYSLFLDSDILVRCDVTKIDTHKKCDSLDYISERVWDIRAVFHSERKFETPSVMLFNNEYCEQLTPEFVGTHPLYKMDWMKRPWPLGSEYNHLVGYDAPNPQAKIVHFTMGVPIWPETIKSEFAQEWIDTFKRMNSSVSFEELMGRSVHVPHLAKVAG